MLSFRSGRAVSACPGCSCPREVAQVTDVFSRMLNIRREELPLAILSALLFFFVLCGYYFLRPVRDAMGVSRGMDEFRWLFVVTSLTSLVVVLAFGGVVGGTNRRRFIPFAYLFVIVCLFGFAGLLIWDAMSGGGLIGTDAQTTLSRVVGYTFFVWLSVINLFITAVFWAFMVDLFNVDQGKRMFAFIGIGGTVGALVGASVTTWISGKTHSIYLPAGLMLTGAAFFAFANAVVSRATSTKPFRSARAICCSVMTEQLPETTSNGRAWPGGGHWCLGVSRPCAAQCAPRAISTPEEPAEKSGCRRLA